MANYTYWNKWITPIFTSEDPEYDKHRKGAIKECLRYYENKDKVHVANLIKNRLYESDFEFFNTARRKNYRSLIHIEKFMKSQFVTCFYDYFTQGHFPEDTSYKFNGITQDDIDVNPKESWVHVSNNIGSWHGTHHHPMTSWGAIYYVDIGDVNEKNGGQNTIRQPFINMYKDDGNFFQHDFELFTINPKNGSVVFFPANLMHNAVPYYGDEQRIVIAANLEISFRK
jgi:hypothetical protein